MFSSKPTLLEACLLALKPIPTSLPLFRVGSLGDGGYLCPDALGGVSGCISPGSNNIKSFEDDLLATWGIPSIIIDASSDEHKYATPMRPGQFLIKKWLKPDHGNSSVSMSEVIHDLNCSNGDLLLQMDIEGSEYENINSWPDYVLRRFRVIIVEFHGLGCLDKPWRSKSKAMMKAITKISQSHFCIHFHPNNCCGSFKLPGGSLVVPNVVECTFLRRDYECEITDQRILLPHPLDASNLPHYPELIADPSWCEDGEAFLSELQKARLSRVLFGIGLELKSFLLRFMSTLKNQTSRWRMAQRH